jgi:hypothetical protein
MSIVEKQEIKSLVTENPDNPYITSITEDPISSTDTSREEAMLPESETENLHRAAEAFAELFRKGILIESEVRSITEHVYCSYLDRLNIGSRYDRLRDNPNRNVFVGAAYNYYCQIFGEEFFRPIHTSVMAERCIKLCFNEYIGYTARSATVHEDTKNAIDLLVDLDDGRTLGLQIKCYTFKVDAPDKLLFPIRSIDDVRKLIRNLAFHGHELTQAQVNQLMDQGNYLLANYRENSKKRNPNKEYAFLVLPSPHGEFARFNPNTGKPDKELPNDLFNEIDKIYFSD